MTAVTTLVNNLVEAIVIPIIVLLFGIALLVFLWGGVEFMLNLNSQEGRQTGARHMFWGIIGMFIMIGAWGILEVLANTFSLPAP